MLPPFFGNKPQLSGDPPTCQPSTLKLRGLSFPCLSQTDGLESEIVRAHLTVGNLLKIDTNFRAGAKRYRDILMALSELLHPPIPKSRLLVAFCTLDA